MRKGERAISLCMPVTIKRVRNGADESADESQMFTRFVYRPNWFVLAQTNGPGFSSSADSDLEPRRGDGGVERHRGPV